VRRRERESSALRQNAGKKLLLGHFSMQVADYQKEAAYFAALMNWKIRSENRTKATLDMGDWGGLVIRGGYRAQAPARGGRSNRTRREPGFDRWHVRRRHCAVIDRVDSTRP
jgi:hypothetical protein